MKKRLLSQFALTVLLTFFTSYSSAAYYDHWILEDSVFKPKGDWKGIKIQGKVDEAIAEIQNKLDTENYTINLGDDFLKYYEGKSVNLSAIAPYVTEIGDRFLEGPNLEIVYFMEDAIQLR